MKFLIFQHLERIIKEDLKEVEYLKKYPNRFPILHIKDETAIGASGKMDYKPIFEQAYANGMKDWYVEVERYDTTPQEDVKKSYDFLNAAEYVK